MVDQRVARGLHPADKADEAEKYQSMLDPSDGTLFPSHPRIVLKVPAAVQNTLENANKVTDTQIREFLEICRVKYLRAKIEPGKTAVVPETTH